MIINIFRWALSLYKTNVMLDVAAVWDGPDTQPDTQNEYYHFIMV